MVTLRDVAQRAGVSIRTVSNVVNDFPYVSDAMRERVQAVIDETGYRPNVAARTLRSGRSGLVGLIVPEVDVPYFAELSRSFIEELSSEGYTLVIDQTDGREERERDMAIGRSRAALFDGLIFNPLMVGTDELAHRPVDTPIVLIGEQVDEATSFDHVAIDNVGAAREATEHLLSLGRTRIAMIGNQSAAGWKTATLREEGFRAALQQAGQPPRPELSIVTPRLHRSDGATGMAELLDSGARPDAALCTNDLLALGALRTLSTRGIRVPDDIAVIGIDDIEDGRFSTPTLSTISPDKAQLARVATQLLLRRMQGGRGPGTRALIDHRLCARESTLGASRPDAEA